MRILIDEGLQTPHRPQSFTVMQAAHDQEDKHHDDRYLGQNKQGVKVSHQIDAFQVDGGNDDHKAYHPHPRRHLGEQRGQINLCQQGVDHRQEQVVEQRGPPHQKTDVRVNGLLRIGIGGTGGRKLANQLAVADGGKQHAGQRQQISGRDVAVGQAGDNAEGVKHRHGRQVSQPHHHHLPQLQAFTQLRLGRLINLDRINRHGVSPLCPLLVTV
ncbi:hypothetical protein D3C80_556730 [compost metagenome]